MSDLSYIIGYILLFLLNAQMLSSWMARPMARREEAFFGLRVNPEVLGGPGQRILQRYRFWLVAAFVGFEAINLLVPIYLGKVSYLLYLRYASNLLWPVCAIVLFSVFQGRVRGFEVAEQKAQIARVALSLKARRLRDYTNYTFEAANAIIFLAAFLILSDYYPELPERLPAHVSWRGVIDGWIPKNFHTIFGGPIWLVYLQTGILLLKNAFVESPRSLPLEHTEERLQYSERFLRLTAHWLDWARAVWLFAIITGLFNVVVWRADRAKLTAGAVRVSTLGIAINIAAQLIFWILVTMPTPHYIYRLYRLRRDLKPVAWGAIPRPVDAEHFSAGGLIYFNPDNPALLVKGPRARTINLANKWVYVCAAYLAGAALLVAWAPELI